MMGECSLAGRRHRVGDTVLAFDPAAALGRGALVPRRVARLQRSTKDAWIQLRWTEDGEWKEMNVASDAFP